MDIVPKIPQRVSELFYIQAQEFEFIGNINEIGQRPFMEFFHIALFVSGTGRGLIKRLGIAACDTKEDSLKNATAHEHH